MSEHSEFRAERLLQLSEEVSRIAGSLAQISIGLTAPVQQSYLAKNSNEPEVTEETVKWLIKARRARAGYLSAELFADPAWDMLLDLLYAELAHRRVSVSSLCIVSDVPATTGLRWLKALEQYGLVVRKADVHDGRRSFVELSPDASKALHCYFQDVIRAPTAAGAATRRES